MACPPEDCGGIYGYYDLLEILEDPKHREHAERKDWAKSQGYDVGAGPTAFNKDDVSFSDMDVEDEDDD